MAVEVRCRQVSIKSCTALAVISVAANNPFGHPDPSVLEALAQAQVEVLRTDQDGAVMERTDGRDLMISRTKNSSN